MLPMKWGSRVSQLFHVELHECFAQSASLMSEKATIFLILRNKNLINNNSRNLQNFKNGAH